MFWRMDGDRFKNAAMIVTILTILTYAIFAPFPSFTTRVGCFIVGLILLLLWVKNRAGIRNTAGSLLMLAANIFYGAMNAQIIQRGIEQTFDQYHFDPLQLCYFGHPAFILILIGIAGLILISPMKQNDEVQE